eukprot:TRINITY_DN566_c0_g1_i3.p1 TRINITY_DN566_c0_g1~~TRINITY_DN566_c0_g1_i3.p1  ORF type:complete len:167 (+),score=25.05 TRINITY_DN566_c0_g1_i3:224-724(+)
MLAERMTFLQNLYQKEQQYQAAFDQRIKREGHWLDKPTQVPTLDRNALSAGGRAMLKSLRNVTESQNFLNGYGPSATSAISSQSPRPMPSSNGKEKGMQALAAARRSDYSSCATCHKRVQQPEFSVTARNGGLQEFCSSKCYFKFEHLRFCFTCHKKNFRPVHTYV